MKNLTLIVCMFILDACSTFRGDKIKEQLSFNQDIDLIISKMEDSHPGLHPEFKDKTFYKKWNGVKPLLNGLKDKTYTNKYGFLKDVDNLFMELGSGHDHLSYGEEENVSKREFPFRFELYAVKNNSNNKFNLILLKRDGFNLDESISKIDKAIVRNINHESVENLIKRFAAVRRNELDWTRKKFAARFLHINMLENKVVDNINLDLEINGKIENVSIPLLVRTSRHSDFPFDLNFSYKVISTPKNGKIVYVKIPMMIDQEIYDAWKNYMSFKLDKKLPVFHKWVAEIADVTKRENASKIVFDIRDNSGGWSSIGVPIISLFKTGAVNVYKTNFRRSYEYWKRIHESTPGIINALKEQINELEGKNKNSANLRKESFSTELAEEESELREAEKYLKNPLTLNEELYTKQTSWKLTPIDKYTPLNIKVDLLTNWRTGSAAEIFAMAFKSSGIGRIVGSPTGNGCNIFTENAMIKLPQSEATLRFSLGFQSWDDDNLSNKPAAGVTPDIQIYQTTEDYLNGVDTIANEVYGIPSFAY